MNEFRFANEVGVVVPRVLETLNAHLLRKLRRS